MDTLDREPERTPAGENNKKTRLAQYLHGRKSAVRILQGTVLSAAVAALAVLSILIPDRKFSDNENRNLAERPEFSATGLKDGSFSRDLTEYASDHFAFRDAWISLDYTGKRLAGQSRINRVYIGRKGHLLAEPETPDEKQLKRLAQQVNAFAKEHSNLNVYFMLVPDAATVTSRYLPSGAPVRDQLKDIDRFRKQLSSDVTYLDVSRTLLEHSEEPVFYKTDHHWTSLGAQYAFDAAASGLGIDSPAPAYKSYLVSRNFRGTLSSKTGNRTVKDEIEIYIPAGTREEQYVVTCPDTKEKSPTMFVSKALKQKDQYQVFFGGNHALIRMQTTSDSTKNLLIFRDSYANSFMQFLYPYYGTVDLVDPRYYYDNAETVINSDGITDILFLYSADTLFTDTSLAACLEAVSE